MSAAKQSKAKQRKAKQSKAKLKLELLTLEDSNAAGSLMDLFEAVRWTGNPTAPAVLESDQSVVYADSLAVDALTEKNSDFSLTPERDQPLVSDQTYYAIDGSQPSTIEFQESTIANQISWHDGGFRIDNENLPSAVGSGDTAKLRDPNIVTTPQTELFTKGGGGLSGGSPMMMASYNPTGVTFTETQYDARVETVTWSGADLITVEADPGTPSYPSLPHWVDLNRNGFIEENVPGERALPVAYPRDTAVTISATFTTVSGMKMGDTKSIYMVKANNLLSATQPYFHTILPTLCDLNGTNIVLPPTTLNGVFLGSVNYGSLELAWQFTNDGGTTWSSAGASKNELYVTLATPTVSPVYHTLIHLSIAPAAVLPAASDAQMLEISWEVWKTKSITNKHINPAHNGMKLIYYKSWDTNNGTTNTLLASRNGNCFAFSQAFADALFAGGYTTKNVFPVTVKGDATADPNVKILVKNWTFSEPGTSGNVKWPYVNEPNKPEEMTFLYKKDAAGPNDDSPESWSYEWGVKLEANDIPDIGDLKGQNNNNPLSFFFNHSLLKIAGTYYDPSYGVDYPSFAAWRNASVSGYARPVPNPNRWLVTKDHAEGKIADFFANVAYTGGAIWVP